MTGDNNRANACKCSEIIGIGGGEEGCVVRGKRVCLRNKCESVRVQVPPSLMRIEREKKIRREYIGEKVKKVVGQMVRSVTGEGEEGVKKDYRNICIETGRARGVVREYGIARQEYRRRGDRGELEGVRRAS